MNYKQGKIEQKKGKNSVQWKKLNNPTKDKWNKMPRSGKTY